MALNLDEQPGYVLHRTALLFRRELMRALRAYDGMTPEQWQTLNTLWKADGGLTPTQISRVTLQELPSISRMVRRMEGSGWVRRAVDPSDARSFRVELTAAGRRLERTVPSDLQLHFRRYLKVLSRTEQDTLIRLLRRLRDALEDGSHSRAGG